MGGWLSSKNLLRRLPAHQDYAPPPHSLLLGKRSGRARPKKVQSAGGSLQQGECSADCLNVRAWGNVPEPALTRCFSQGTWARAGLRKLLSARRRYAGGDHIIRGHAHCGDGCFPAAEASFSHLAWAGNTMMNVAPLPSSLSTSIRPPCSARIDSLMLRPRPVPPAFVV